jgi:CubicO group peptidase (beta-lactamase class C family)
MPRMSCRRAVVALLFALVAGAPAAAHTPPLREDATTSVGEIGERIVAFAERAAAGGFSGAVLAARDGEVVAAVGVGSADAEGRVPNTPATLFEIASVTKQFTAAAAMRLVQDGKLRLDDPISKHLPGVPESCAAITVEHLLRHTSGIPGSNSQGSGDEIERVLPTFLRGGPRHEPGTRFEYWNQGYAIVSEIIARAAGKPYTAYCAEALFAPAGMRGTCFTGDDAPGGAAVAVGRSSRGAPRSALEHPYGAYGFQYRGMGGAVTSVWDLWRWDRALRGDGVLAAEWRARLFEPGPGSYGLGWVVRRDRSGRLVHSHGGGVRGFICEVRRYPDEDALLVVLCNRDDFALRGLVQPLEDMLFGGAAPEPLDAGLVGSLAGRYLDGSGRVLLIVAEGGVARAEVHWSASGPVTRAVLERGDGGKVVLNDGSDRHELAIEREGDKPAASVTILDMTFRRADP